METFGASENVSRHYLLNKYFTSVEFGLSVKPKSRSAPAGNCAKQIKAKSPLVNVTVGTDETKMVPRITRRRALDDEPNVSGGSNANLARYGLLF